MNNKSFDNSTESQWDKDLDWATNENWVRAAASLEAEAGVDIFAGDLQSNLNFSVNIVPTYINVERLTVFLQEGLTDLLSPEDLTALISETHSYIRDRIYQRITNSN
jgi:hypothetical protein